MAKNPKLLVLEITKDNVYPYFEILLQFGNDLPENLSRIHLFELANFMNKNKHFDLNYNEVNTKFVDYLHGQRNTLINKNY
jgi:hypothetical protein